MLTPVTPAAPGEGTSHPRSLWQIKGNCVSDVCLPAASDLEECPGSSRSKSQTPYAFSLCLPSPGPPPLSLSHPPRESQELTKVQAPSTASRKSPCLFGLYRLLTHKMNGDQMTSLQTQLLAFGDSGLWLVETSIRIMLLFLPNRSPDWVPS